MNRRAWQGRAVCGLALIGVALLAAGLGQPARAALADRPLKIIVGFTPGGTADAVARILAQALAARMGQPFIVENKAGANGNLATDFVAHATADGHTLFFTSIGHVVNPSLYKDARYDPVKDFSPIGQVLSAPNVLVVPGNSPFNTLKDLIAHAKANPGQLSFASSGLGASVHLSGELFKEQAGVDLLHIPYKGTGSLMPDLLSGVVSMAFPNLPSALPLIRSGRLKALGVTTAKRSDAAPNIPTIAQAGVPGYDMSTWYGLLGPAKMAPETIQRLNDELQAVLRDPDIRGRLQAQGVDPVGGSPQEFAAFLQQEQARWAAILKRSKITAE
jgi:tripartite-type tricarboxylate transporter receptor subunit TctC